MSEMWLPKYLRSKEMARNVSIRGGGVCVLHGPGAKMKYKPVMTVTTGPDGKKSRVMKKERYFACDLALSVVGGGVKGVSSARPSCLSRRQPRNLMRPLIIPDRVRWAIKI